MAKIELIEVDYESLIRNMTTKESFFEVSFRYDSRPYRMLFKKTFTSPTWVPNEILEEQADESFIFVTDTFPDVDYERIAEFLYIHTDVQKAMHYFNSKEQEDFSQIDEQEHIRKIGERIWKKICREIQCVFLMDKGNYIFVLPFLKEGTNSIKVSLQELMFSYDSEDAFVQHAIRELQNLERKKSNIQFLNPHHYMRYCMLCDQNPDLTQKIESRTILYLAAGDEKLANYLLPYFNEEGLYFVDLHLEQDLEKPYIILTKLASTLYDDKYYMFNIGDFAELDERLLNLALLAIQFRYSETNCFHGL